MLQDHAKDRIVAAGQRCEQNLRRAAARFERGEVLSGRCFEMSAEQASDIAFAWASLLAKPDLDHPLVREEPASYLDDPFARGVSA